MDLLEIINNAIEKMELNNIGPNGSKVFSEFTIEVYS